MTHFILFIACEWVSEWDELTIASTMPIIKNVK